jgi:hypothetical protein
MDYEKMTKKELIEYIKTITKNDDKIGLSEDEKYQIQEESFRNEAFLELHNWSGRVGRGEY